MFVFTFVLLLHNTSVEHKILTRNSHTVSQHSPTPPNALCTTRETGKRTFHNLVENPLGIRISTGKSGLEGESTTFMKRSQLVLYKILHYSIRAVKEILSIKFQLQPKIANSNIVILICLVILLHKLLHLAIKW